jgi:hypothetical protein
MLSKSIGFAPQRQQITCVPHFADISHLCLHQNWMAPKFETALSRAMLNRHEPRQVLSLRATATPWSSKSKEYFIPASLAAVVWRASWRGIWLQGALSSISMIALCCAISLQRLPTSTTPVFAPTPELAFQTVNVALPSIAYWMCTSGASATAMSLFLSLVNFGFFCWFLRTNYSKSVIYCRYI